MTTAPHVAWEQFTLDPRRPDSATLRASDHDRDVAAGALSEAFADGRLDRAELDERLAAVHGAKRLGELAAPLRDLAPERPARSPVSVDRQPERRPEPASGRSRRAGPSWVLLVPVLVCWAVWLTHGYAAPDGSFAPGFPWPLFVTLGVLKLARGHRHWASHERHHLQHRRGW